MKRLLKFIIFIFFSLIYKVELLGKENIPKKGAAILCANHIFALDIFSVGSGLKRLVHFMAKEELFRNPILAPLIRWFGAFPVKRGKADVGAIKTAIKLLEKEHIIGIFPQGTRTRGKDISDISIQRGVVMIAINAGVPITPVGIKATYKPFSKVKVVFGKPFYLNIEKGKKCSREEMNEFAKNLMDKVYELVEDND